jgi:hypothetical protein
VKHKYRLFIEVPPNKRTRKATITIKGKDEKTLSTDKVDLWSRTERTGFAARLAERLQVNADALEKEIETRWAQALDVRAMEQQAARDKAASPDGASCGVLEYDPKPAAALLVKLAGNAGVQLWHTPDRDGFATIPLDGRSENWKLRSTGFRLWLAREFHKYVGKPAGSQALQDAVAALEGKAIFEGEQHPVHVRLAEHGGRIYLDLADKDWRVIEVDADGWRVHTKPPVKFRRTRGMLPLPEPQGGGSLEELRPFLNTGTGDEGDNIWVVTVAWILQGLRGRGPYPVLAIHGEQGSAKSTLGKVLRKLIDPNKAEIRAAPRDERDLVIAASNGLVIGYDNLSYLPDWLSDALCRLATGGGYATRELFTDGDEAIFDAQRPILLNGIEDVITRGDLLDRALVVTLPTIEPHHRQTEARFSERFEKARPRILGALLTAVSGAMRELPHVQLRDLPRMADFAVWATASGKALG